MDFLNTLARAVQSAGTEFKKELFASTPPTAPLPQAMPTTHATAHTTPQEKTQEKTQDTTTTTNNPPTASVYLTQQQLQDYRNRLLSPRGVK